MKEDPGETLIFRLSIHVEVVLSVLGMADGVRNF